MGTGLLGVRKCCLGLTCPLPGRCFLLLPPVSWWRPLPPKCFHSHFVQTLQVHLQLESHFGDLCNCLLSSPKR